MELTLDMGNEPLTEPQMQTESLTEFACEVCGVPLTYGGRGRKPKFCSEHKKSAPSVTRSRGTNIDTLITQIQNLYLGMSTGLTMIPPTAQDGMIIAANAERMAESWRPLIERDPKVRKFWERICTGGGWGSVVMSHGFVAMAIMQVHGVKLPLFGSTELSEPNV